MSDQSTKARLNQLSYFWTILFSFPAFITGVWLARSYENTANSSLGVAEFARITSLILVGFLILWSVRRLHDFNRSGWWTLLLLPPATVFFLIYLLIMPSAKGTNRWGDVPTTTRIYGIRWKGVAGIAFILLLSIFFVYLAGLYVSFLVID